MMQKSASVSNFFSSFCSCLMPILCGICLLLILLYIIIENAQRCQNRVTFSPGDFDSDLYLIINNICT